MPNKIVYIGYYCEQSYFTHLIEKDKKRYSQARQNLEYSLLEGLKEQGEIDVISYVPYSATMSCPSETILDQIRIINICVEDNLPGVIKGALSIFRILGKKENGTKILMYAVNPMFVIPAILLRRKKRFELCTICSELPQYRRWKEKLKNRIKHGIQAFLNRRFDKYILLAEKMKDVIPVKRKPYMVMEGIYSGTLTIKTDFPQTKAVMYAGGLSEDNGIKHIINGFKVSNADELWVCGGGPLEEYVRTEAQNNCRIKYLGMVSVDEVRRLEREAFLLVCVRDNKNPLTMYSFPSKILEYLASGTRVAVSKLDGVPQEYYEYVETINDYDFTSIKECINRTVLLNENEYQVVSQKQITFVQNNKCPAFQGKRVYDFILK